jgi:hypothetical protein
MAGASPPGVAPAICPPGNSDDHRGTLEVRISTLKAEKSVTADAIILSSQLGSPRRKKNQAFERLGPLCAGC